MKTKERVIDQPPLSPQTFTHKSVPSSAMSKQTSLQTFFAPSAQAGPTPLPVSVTVASWNADAASTFIKNCENLLSTPEKAIGNVPDVLCVQEFRFTETNRSLAVNGTLDGYRGFGVSPSREHAGDHFYVGGAIFVKRRNKCCRIDYLFASRQSIKRTGIVNPGDELDKWEGIMGKGRTVQCGPDELWERMCTFLISNAIARSKEQRFNARVALLDRSQGLLQLSPDFSRQLLDPRKRDHREHGRRVHALHPDRPVIPLPHSHVARQQSSDLRLDFDGMCCEFGIAGTEHYVVRNVLGNEEQKTTRKTM